MSPYPDPSMSQFSNEPTPSNGKNVHFNYYFFFLTDFIFFKFHNRVSHLLSQNLILILIKINMEMYGMNEPDDQG